MLFVIETTALFTWSLKPNSFSKDLLFNNSKTNLVKTIPFLWTSNSSNDFVILSLIFKFLNFSIFKLKRETLTATTSSIGVWVIKNKPFSINSS